MVNIVDKDGTGNIDFPEFLLKSQDTVPLIDSGHGEHSGQGRDGEHRLPRVPQHDGSQGIYIYNCFYIYI